MKEQIIADEGFINWLSSNVHFRFLPDTEKRKIFTNRDKKWDCLELLGKKIDEKTKGKKDNEIMQLIRNDFNETHELIKNYSHEDRWELGDYLLSFQLPRPPFSQEIGIVNSAEDLLEIFKKRKKRFPGIVEIQVFEMHDYRGDGRIKKGKWVYVVK